MKMYALGVIGLFLLVLAGCAPGCHAGPSARPEHYPSYSDVPPSFYNYDPTLMHWYTMPYWNPEQGP